VVFAFGLLLCEQCGSVCFPLSVDVLVFLGGEGSVRHSLFGLLAFRGCVGFRGILGDLPIESLSRRRGRGITNETEEETHSRKRANSPKSYCFSSGQDIYLLYEESQWRVRILGAGLD
jgi:hypothetical protein